MIKKAKLNCCAVCEQQGKKVQENLHVTFSTDGKMYFLCTIHMKLDEILQKVYQEGFRNMGLMKAE